MDTGWHLRLAMVLLVATMATTGGVVFASSANGQAESLLVQGSFDADDIRINIDLRANGSATWTVEFWRALDDDESTAAFESLQEDIETDPENYTVSFAEGIRETVDTASTATGREMTAESFSIATEQQSLAREYGVVRYSFEWHGFASVDDSDIRAGDAIEGFYLDDGTRLLISWPEEYELRSLTPEADDRRPNAVLWNGASTDFITGEPRVVVTPAQTGPSLGTLAGLLGLVAVLAGLGGWLLRRRSVDTATGDESNSDATGSASTPDSEADSDDTPSDSASSAVADVESTPPSEPDSSLLSNEEQVMQLLADHDGRMKQQTIVKELGWTDAKTSKVVSKLRDEDAIESFRIGRENVLTRPDEDPLDEP